MYDTIVALLDYVALLTEQVGGRMPGKKKIGQEGGIRIILRLAMSANKRYKLDDFLLL